MSKIDYTRLQDLDKLYLEDSFVIGISTKNGAVEFSLDAVLTPRHPGYHKPPPGKYYCFKKLVLRFPNAKEVDWGKSVRDVGTDAAGETDIGHIDSFYLDGGRYHLAGDWGAVSIRSDTPVIVE